MIEGVHEEVRGCGCEGVMRCGGAGVRDDEVRGGG